MFGGTNRLLLAAVFAAAVFVVPSTALAGGCGGGPSAEQVYNECVPNGSGGTHSRSHASSTSGGPSSGSTSVPLTPQAKKTIAKAGKDKKSLKHLVKAFGVRRTLESSHSPVAEPTAIGSAFDLGSGPTALLIVLAGTAIVLLGATGFRTVRQRRT